VGRINFLLAAFRSLEKLGATPMPNRSTADIAETIAITTLRNELGDGGIVTKIRDDISTAAEISTLARTIGLQKNI
jgi:hypothetical protein